MAALFKLDSAWIAAERQRICSQIGYVRYRIGSAWQEKNLLSASVVADGAVEATVLLTDPGNTPVTVTDIELYDRNGNRIGERTVSIAIANPAEGMPYCCRIELFEIEENAGHTGAYDAASE